MKVSRHTQALALAGALALAAATGHGQWPQIHLDSSNHATTGAPASVTDLTTGPQFTTGAQDLPAGVRPIIAGGQVFAVATQSSPSERIWIKSFNAADLAPEDESADLDTGNSVSFGSVTAPAADGPNGWLYFMSGSTAYRLATSDLSTDWSTTIDASNTSADADAHYGNVNASPIIADGHVYIKTYDDGFSTEGAQVVSLDQATGAVEWYAKVGGRGTATGVYIPGTTPLFVTDSQSTTEDVVLKAYDPDSTGAATAAWTSAALNVTTGFHGQWVEPIFANSKIYGVTTDVAFPGPAAGRLYQINPSDGTLDWNVGVVGADVPPVLLGGSLYVLHSNGEIRQYDPADGSQIGTGASVAASPFRDYWAASSDGIYLSISGSGLRFFDLAVSEQSASPATTYAGPTTVDPSTGYVYTHDESGGLALFTGTTSVRDFLLY